MKDSNDKNTDLEFKKEDFLKEIFRRNLMGNKTQKTKTKLSVKFRTTAFKP